MSRLIGLGGKLRAGKDAVGDYLEEKHDFVKLGMSDALNEALLKLNPWIPVPSGMSADVTYLPYAHIHEMYGYVEAKKNPEVRRLLQVLGTEVGREMIDQDVWVKIAEKKILEHWANGKSVVITAMRFPNEIEMLERLGGFSVWVERPTADRLGDTQGDEVQIGAHASENSVSEVDFQFTLLNDSTLDALYAKVEEVLRQANKALKTV